MQFFTTMYATPNGDSFDDMFCMEEIFNSGPQAEQGIIDWVNAQRPFHPITMEMLKAVSTTPGTVHYTLEHWIPVFWITQVEI